MRKLFIPIVVAIIFTACNSDTKEKLETKKVVLSTDTTVQNNAGASADTAAAVQTDAAPPAVDIPVVTPKPVNPAQVTAQKPNNVIPHKRPARTVTKASSDNVNTSSNTNTSQNNPTAPADNASIPSNGTDNNGTSPSNGTTDNGTSAGTTTGTTQPTKKGWNNASKDAVIGGAAGAIGGAIISKKKGKGAIIGGIVGAAGGYILGKKKDKANADTSK